MWLVQHDNGLWLQLMYTDNKTVPYWVAAAMFATQFGFYMAAAKAASQYGGKPFFISDFGGR